ncbi:MAG: glycosyltransferase family 4 protein [Candidatus Marinamargulisbacteria bacterium]
MTKLAIYISNRFKFYDMPKKRKSHQSPMPMLGGFALIVTILINMGMVLSWEWSPFNAGLLGAVGVFLIGLYDDKYTLSPFVKLVAQSVVILWLFLNGVRIDFLTWPFNDVAPLFFNTVVSFIVTQLWMLVVMNMFNIIDGIDGLAVGISFLTAIVLFFVSLSVSPLLVTYLICAIIATTGTFLRFNFFPAKIFLGDSGALLLGYLFALVSILGVLKSTISFVVFGFIFAIPLMDILLSVVRRLLKRRNIFYPDLAHMHHQLVRRGLSVRRSTLVLYILSLTFGLFAIFAAYYGHDLKLLIGGLFFLAVLTYFSFLQMSQKRFRTVRKNR